MSIVVNALNKNWVRQKEIPSLNFNVQEKGCWAVTKKMFN